jgi:FdhD protein
MHPADRDPTVRATQLVRFAGAVGAPAEDAVACEEPLEIRLGDTPLAVVMRTPGHDEELALGFLVTERVVRSLDDVVRVSRPAARGGRRAAGNSVVAELSDGVEVDLERLRRNLFASSSCGVCGKATLDNALAVAPPLDDPLRLPAAFFPPLPERLRAAQVGFDRTGGLHAAGLFDASGALLAAREDVGRHNAVDKLVGWAAREKRLPLAGHVLLVSGRISFEIVQKALAARIPVVAAVSAPSSLAVDLATRARMTLVGFLRGGGFNVYGRAERVAE